MVEPLSPQASFVVGRRDGPAYFGSEALRLRYLLAAISPEIRAQLLISSH